MTAEARAPLMDEMAQVVARAAHLSPEQGRVAVAALLRFLTARLPSALVGELHAQLGSRSAHEGEPTDGAR